MKKILILGGSGLTGSILVAMAVKDFNVCATYLSNPISVSGCEFVQLDITSRENVFSLMGRLAPDVVVHTVGIASVDFCETNPKEAWRIHVEATKNIADACKRVGSKLIFMSTDFVFDGEKDRYAEEDKPNPISVYAETKLEAEKVIQSADIDYAIVRPAVIYGWHPKSRFLNWVLQKLVKKEKVSVFIDQYSCPTLVYNLAEAILALAKTDKTGIYHTVGGSCVNRYEFAKKAASIFGLDDRLVEPTRSCAVKQAAKRPKKLCLDKSKAERELKVKFLGMEEGLAETKRRSSIKSIDDLITYLARLGSS